MSIPNPEAWVLTPVMSQAAHLSGLAKSCPSPPAAPVAVGRHTGVLKWLFVSKAGSGVICPPSSSKMENNLVHQDHRPVSCVPGLMTVTIVLEANPAVGCRTPFPVVFRVHLHLLRGPLHISYPNDYNSILAGFPVSSFSSSQSMPPFMAIIIFLKFWSWTDI